LAVRTDGLLAKHQIEKTQQPFFSPLSTLTHGIACKISSLTIFSSNRNECNAFDQGLLTVSGHSVQLTDASEFATCVHVSGLRNNLLIQLQ
jgi:hypothetical protein